MFETISSSNPRMDSICISIQWVIMGTFTLESFTFWEKDGGNLVVRRSLFRAFDELIDAVPFIDGILLMLIMGDAGDGIWVMGYGGHGAGGNFVSFVFRVMK